jgi:hypothetical protein
MNKVSTVEYSNGPVATRKFKTAFHTYGERMEVGGIN